MEQLTDHQYRTLPRIANSDLSELAGQKMKASPETLAFGTAFHTLILEPGKPPVDLQMFSESQVLDLSGMTRSIILDINVWALVEHSKHEVVKTWTDPETGLPLKCKIDIVEETQRYNHLADLKTTSCTTHQRFLDSCYDYEYYRQAAFYLSSDSKAQFFSFIGVQKVAPYNLYKLDFHRSSDFVQRGMKRVGYLLKLAKESGFVPSSWSRKEETV